MAHVFEKYFRRHGHYPRIRLRNGVQKITVEFAPGYVRVKTSPPYQGEVYILASTIRKILKHQNFLNLVRRQSEDFDVPDRVHQAHLEELVLQQELRTQKKQRGRAMEDVEARERQRKRFLAAQARAAKKNAE